MEARSQDGGLVCDKYAVIWLPKVSRPELLHMRQTNPSILGLARLANRKGVRVSASDAEKVHRAGPFPYGSTRESIQKAFAQRQWCAQPMQIALGVRDRGYMWIAQSVAPPPSQIIEMSHGERQWSSTGCCSLDLALCETSSKATASSHAEDLLQTQDPWKPWKPSSSPAPTYVPSATESMRQMEERITQAVLAKLPQATPMICDDVPERLASMENQVQRIMAHHTTVESSLQEVSNKADTQLASRQHQIKQVHGHMESQQQSILQCSLRRCRKYGRYWPSDHAKRFLRWSDGVGLALWES